MTQNELKINRDTLREAHVEILRLGGTLDAHSFEELQSILETLFSEGSYNIVLDMADLTYISSAGVGALVAATHEAADHAGHVILVHVQDKVREVLKLLGLDTTFTMAPDLKSALAATQL